MAEETKEYLDYDGLSEYHKKSEELFQDLTIEEVEEAFNELDESDPSYSAFYDVITKAKEATAKTDEAISKAETATTNATEATSKADEATERANKAAEKLETIDNVAPVYLGALPEEKLIQSNEDLNNYKIPGTYSVTSNNVAKTIDNSPTELAFKLFVEYATGNKSSGLYIRQRLIEFSEPSIEYIRYIDTWDFKGEWSEWRQTVNNKSLIPANQGGTGWDHGLNSGVNIVPGTSNEWSRWLTPTLNKTNISFFVSQVKYPEDREIGDIYTTMIEIEFDSVTKSDAGSFLFRFQGSSIVGGKESWDSYLNPFIANKSGEIGYIETAPSDGIQRFVYQNTLTNSLYTSEDLTEFIIGFRCDNWASGRFRYRCLKIERGHVDYPQWSPAPEDVAKINDITTGTNLIRGTRDFVLGTNVIPGTSDLEKRYLDGFRNDGGFTFSKDEEGYTVAERVYKSTDASVKSLDAYIYPIEPDCEYTISAEVYISADFQKDKNIAACFINDKVKGSIVKSKYYNPSTLNIQPGEWNKYIVHFSTSDIGSPIEVCYLGIRFSIESVGTLKVRKIKTEKGRINNPDWSPSPFDTNYIQEAGINLLRGTRDFSQGTKKSPYTASNRIIYTDGFADIDQTIKTTKVDTDGFTVLNIEGHDLTSDLWRTVRASGFYPVSTNDVYTLFGEFMVDKLVDSSTGINAVVGIEFYDGTQQNRIGLIDYSTTDLANGTITTNTWYKFVKVFTIPAGISKCTAQICLRLPRNGSINFKKIGVYEGLVNNPEWSASPFDVAQRIDIERSTVFSAVDKITLSDGYELTGFDVHQATPLIVQIVFSIKNKNVMNANTDATIATLDSSLCPVNITPINGQGWGVHGIISSTGRITVMPSTQVAAGSTNYFGAIYVLKTPLS